LDFRLSSEDEKSVPPHLSAWVEEYTTPLQAYSFLKPDSPRKIIYWLNAGDIRNIYLEINKQKCQDLLDVLWINIAESRLGAEGHAGITGLNQKDKLLRKDLRFKLAEIANKNVNDISRQLNVEL